METIKMGAVEMEAIENVYFTKYQTGWDHGEIYLLKTKRKSFKS